MTTVRSLFLSDIHLGTRACQAGRLLEFLQNHTADNVFLIGDVVDFWAMRRTVYWTSEQNTVIQKILKRARHGVRVVFIPGNHDEALRDYVGITFGNVEVLGEYVHELADGRRFLLLHGDEFDQITRHHRWIAVLGDVTYGVLVRLNALISFVRRRFGVPYHWSLAGYAKRRVKTALQFIFDFEDSASHAARARGVDGIICGHIHSASMREANGVIYANCGDWVDSCTAIVEHLDGRLEVITWGARNPVLLNQPKEELACAS